MVGADHLYTAGRRRLVELLSEAARPITIPQLVAIHPEVASSTTSGLYSPISVMSLMRPQTRSGGASMWRVTAARMGRP